jgi:hypothetical protein
MTCASIMLSTSLSCTPQGRRIEKDEWTGSARALCAVVGTECLKDHAPICPFASHLGDVDGDSDVAASTRADKCHDGSTERAAERTRCTVSPRDTVTQVRLPSRIDAAALRWPRRL